MVNIHYLLNSPHHLAQTIKREQFWGKSWIIFFKVFSNIYQSNICTFSACNLCSGYGAVVLSHAALQHLLHNLCCDRQASINLGSLCSIIISLAIQLDSTQQGSWHCGGSQNKTPSEQARLPTASPVNLLRGGLVNKTLNTVQAINTPYSDLASCWVDVCLKTKMLYIKIKWIHNMSLSLMKL